MTVIFIPRRSSQVSPKAMQVTALVLGSFFSSSSFYDSSLWGGAAHIQGESSFLA